MKQLRNSSRDGHRVKLPKIKNRTQNLIPEKCTHHSFCNNQHEFCDQGELLKDLSKPTSQYTGDSLPDYKNRMNEDNEANISIHDITEEAIDDWIA